MSKKTRSGSFLLTASLALALSACGSHTALRAEPTQVSVKPAPSPHWSYSGVTGPGNWGKLDPSFAACADGTEQSPVDIETAKTKVDKTAVQVERHYHPTGFTLVNTGHTIQANPARGTNRIILDGMEYTLAQMHFHKPSEHTVNGQPYEMEGHLVHKNEAGDLAVLGFLIRAGRENPQLAEMWSKLPKKETKEGIQLEQPVDLSALLPSSAHAFRYNGSLTTPPCTEHVKWIVLADPVEMSREQIQAFGTIFPDNHRPVQPLHNRAILSN